MNFCNCEVKTNPLVPYAGIIWCLLEEVVVEGYVKLYGKFQKNCFEEM